MRKLFLAIALWDLVVAFINIGVLWRFTSPEVLVYMTPTSQFLPVFICLALAWYYGKGQLCFDWRKLVREFQQER